MMADWAAQQQHHPHLAAAQAAVHNLVNCVDRTLRIGHSLREESHGVAKEAQQLLQDLEAKAQACSGMSQAAVAQAAARIAAALDTLRMRVTELQQQQQQGGGGLIIARLTRPNREKSFLQEARSQLQGACSFIREEHQRAKEAATAATAPSPLQAASASQQQQQQQQQLAGAGSTAAPGGTPFADIPRSLPSSVGTVALVPMVQHGGSVSSSDCVLWLCSNKKVEFIPSWAPTAGKTELVLQDKFKAVTCVAADSRSGQIWTGHADGSVQLHLPSHWCCASLPPEADATGAIVPGSPVCSMALDCPLPHGRRSCWVGDEAGSIRVVTHDPGSSRLAKRFENAPGAAAAAVMNRSAGTAVGAPVSTLLGFEGLMLSAGGNWLYELCAWDARSWERVEQHNCQGIGAATCLTLLPWSCDSGAGDEYSGTSSTGSAAYDCWRLLSGHDSGQLALWQMRPRPASPSGPRVLQQLVLIDALPKSAIRGIAVVSSLSMLVLAQESSWLTVVPFPSETNGALPPGSAAASKPSSKPAGAGCAMPGLALGMPASSLAGAGVSAALVAAHRWSPKVARIKAHSRSLAAFASLGELIVTASGKSVKPWTAEHLRLEAQGDGVIISRPSEQLRRATGGSGSSSRLGSARSLALSAADSSTLLSAGSSAAARQASLETAQQLQHSPPPQQQLQLQPAVGWLLAQSKQLQQQQQQQQQPTMFGQVSASPRRDQQYQPQVSPSVGNVVQQQQQQQQGTHLHQLTSAAPAQQQMLQQLGPQLAELSPLLQPPQQLLQQVQQQQPQQQVQQQQQQLQVQVQQQQLQVQQPPHLIKPDSHPGDAWRDPTAVMPRQQTLQQALQAQSQLLQPQLQARARSPALGVQAHHIISKSELTKKKEIGMGAEGKVYWATWMNIDVAAKEYLLESSAGTGQLSKEEAVQRAADALQREAELLASLNHPNLVRFCGVCLDPPLLVMELYRHGNVWTMLHKARRQWEQPRLARGHKQAASGAANKYVAYFTWDRRLEMLHNVAAGMVYLHKRCYVHGDLRSPNLFVGSDGQVKIGDFGFTKLLSSEGGRLQVKRITHPRWVAPELLRDGSLSAACDVYSFGMIMMEMLTWQKPFSAVDDEQQVVADVLNGLRPEVPAPSLVPQGPASTCGLLSYVRLMQQCYDRDPAQRPTFASIASRLKAMLHWRMIIRAQRLKSDAWLKLLHRAQAEEAAAAGRRKQHLQAGAEPQQPAPAGGPQATDAAWVAGRKVLWTSGVGDASFSSTRSALIGTAMGPGNPEQCLSQPSSLDCYSSMMSGAGHRAEPFSSAAGGHHDQPSSTGSVFSDGLASSSLSAAALSRINQPSFNNRSQPGSSSMDLLTPMPSGSRGPHPALRYSSSSRSSSSSSRTIWGSSAGVSPWQIQQQQQQQLAADGDPATLARLSAAAAAMAALPAAAGSSLEPVLSTVHEVPDAREPGSASASAVAAAAEHDRDEQAMRDLEAFNQLDRPRQSQHSSLARHQQQVPPAPAAEAQAPAAAALAPAVAAAATESLLAGLRPDLRRLAIDGNELIIKQELEQASVTTGNVLHGSVFLGTWCGIDIAAKQFMAPQDCGACSSSAPMADVCVRAKATLVQVLPVLSGLNHPNVVRLFGVCLDPPLDCNSPLPLVITEFYRHGSVWKMLQQARQQYLQPPDAATGAASSTSGSQATDFKYAGYLSWQRRLEMLQDVAAGLNYLGKAGYEHTGLRSSRLYVNSAGRVKVGGLASLCGPDAASTAASDLAGSSSSAMSQFGALMFEVLTWQTASQEALQAVAACTQELAIPRVSAAAAQKRLLHSSGGTAAAVNSQLAAGLASLAGNAGAAAGLTAYVQLLRDCLGTSSSSSPGAQQQQLTFQDVSGRLTAIMQESAAVAAAPRGSGAAAAAAVKKLSSSAAGAAAAGRLTPAKTSSSPALLEQQQACAAPLHPLPGAASTAASSRAASTASEDDSCPPSAPEKSASSGAGTAQAAVSALPETRYLELMPPVVLDSLSEADISMPGTPTTPISWGAQSGPAARQELPAFAETWPSLPDAAPADAAAAAGTAASAAVCGTAAAAAGDPPAQQAAVEDAAAAALAPAAPGCLEARGTHQATPAAAATPPAAAVVLPPAPTEPVAAAAPAATPGRAAAQRQLSLLPFVDFIPSPVQESAAVIQHELQQLQLLRPQLHSQVLRLALLQTLFCATNATSTVRLYMQHCAQALQQQQQPGSSSGPPQLQTIQVSAELQAVQDFVSRQLQLLTIRLRRHYQRQQHQQHGASLHLLSLVICMCQLQAALREWRQAAEQQLLDCTAVQQQVGLSCILSSRGGSEGSSVQFAAAAVLLGCGALLLPVVLQAAARSVALLLVALWLGWLLLSRAGVGSVGSDDTQSANPAGSRRFQPDAGTAAALQQQQQPWPAPPALLVLQDMQDSRAASTCVAVQACATSSTVGRTAWPVQLAAGDEAAAGCQQGLLHTLPEDKYLNGWKLREQQQQQQEEAATGTPAAVSGESGLVKLSQHQLLGGPVLSSANRPAGAAFLHRLQQLLASKQQQRQQLFVPVLWVCQEPPMLLEAGQPGLPTLASWLQQQQQRQRGGADSNSSSAAGSWQAPFPAAAWPQVLGWLRQVAAALDALHGSQLVHGGVSAAAVHLVAGNSSNSSSTSGSSSDDGTSGKQQQQQLPLRACLSLASPWQHAVTHGRVMDAALASPEVLAGASPTGAAAADVYGFGLLMWQLATGWLPQPQSHLRCDGGRAGVGGCGGRGGGSAGLREELELYDELAWCGEMVRLFGTTFPGAAAGAAGLKQSGAAPAAGGGGGGSSSGQIRPATAGLRGSEEEEEEEAGEPLILSDAAFAARHGVLPGEEGVDDSNQAAAAVRAWLPAGYRRLMHDCCRSDPDSRLDMQQLRDRLQQVAAGAGVTGW